VTVEPREAQGLWSAVQAQLEIIARRGHFQLPQLQREARRTLARMEQELTKDWKAGKPVQRRQNLAFLPLVWEQIYGLDLRQPTPSSPRGLVLPPVKGHETFARMVAEQVAMSMAGHPQAQQGAGYVSGQILMAVHTTLFPIWTYMKASKLGEPNVFAVRDSLVEKLLNTDIDNVRADEVRLPFPGLYVSFPFGDKLLLLRNQQTGFHEVSFVGIAEGELGGERSLFCTFWGEPQPGGRATSDDHVYSFSFDLPSGDDSSLSALLESADERQRREMEEHGIPLMIKRDVARLYDESFDFYDAVGLLRRFVINFCLYLSSPHPDIEPTRGGQRHWETVAGAREPKRTKVRVSRKTSRRKGKVQAASYAVWDVGRNVEKLQRRSVATDILVRGHFRHQAHGVGRALRKIIWIEPHIRLPSEGAAGEGPGHEYDVVENAEP